jgi:hypothetical protein
MALPCFISTTGGTSCIITWLTSRCVGPEDTRVLSSTSQSFEDELVEIFARLDIQSTNFGVNAPRFRLTTENLSTSKEAQIPHSFSGLREARQHFDVIANAIHRFLTMSTDTEFHNPANPSAVAQQTDLLTKLQEWSQAFEKLLPRLSTGPGQHPDSNATLRETKPAILLRLHHTFLRIKLSVGLACCVETTYDKFIDDFNAIVSLAEDLTGTGRQTDSDTPRCCCCRCRRPRRRCPPSLSTSASSNPSISLPSSVAITSSDVGLCPFFPPPLTERACGMRRSSLPLPHA